MIGLRWVFIYENGFVRIKSNGAKAEKLLSIQAGRTDGSLIIVTEDRTHTFQAMTESGDANAHALEAAGRAVLAALQARATAQQQIATKTSVNPQTSSRQSESNSREKGFSRDLTELARLFSEGLLTEAEFSAAKRKVLGIDPN
jgi:hypothetical protein